MATSTTNILRVGIIGCGEISQIAHIPIVNALSDLFQTTYLCDISQNALAHCARRVQGPTPKTTTNAEELCASPDVDVVIVANADAYHAPHAILALKHHKYCLLEKPAAICFRDIDAIIAAEEESRGWVLVGTMRRYATAFLDAIEEVGGMSKVQYARVRDIIGPNGAFQQQGGFFAKAFGDFSEKDAQDRLAREQDTQEQALGEFGVPVTPESRRMVRVLGALGTHDLSAMRELIGMPQSVAGAVLTLPGIFSVLFQYNDFPVTYESGLSNVMQFDAHIEVYSAEKIVRVDYDSPYVKGLPVTMTIRENAGEGGFQERKIRKTYLDPHTLQMMELHGCIVGGRRPKTTVADARQDIELYQMILQAGADRFRA
ncbi:hypothetical protein ACHAQA_005279 [Verticillium albo-atrum]